MKNKKGISIINLILIIAILIIILILRFINNDNNSKPTSSVIKEDRSTYIAKCKTIDYTSLARNPSRYKGQYFVLTGEVIQVMEDNNNLMLRVNVTEKRYEYSNKTYYEDTILVAYQYSSSYESRILEDDIVTIYGQSIGTHTYQSVLGASITIPAIKAMYIDIK